MKFKRRQVLAGLVGWGLLLLNREAVRLSHPASGEQTQASVIHTLGQAWVVQGNTAIEPVPFANQNRLGIVGNILAGGSDNAGFPNGRRPKDDVVDISLIAVMGGLCMANGDNDALGFGPACKPSAVPLKETAFKLHDAVDQAVVPLLAGFPYLNTPMPGAQ